MQIEQFLHGATFIQARVHPDHDAQEFQKVWQENSSLRSGIRDTPTFFGDGFVCIF